jgi:hypothetical protein
MQTLFIPPLGTQMTLEQDWSFTLHYENRFKSHLTILEMGIKDW